MDSSHVSLCALVLRAEGFNFYRCDKPFALGLNTPNLAKILKCAGNEDVVTLRCNEQSDSITLVFESPSQDRISDFEFKLMDIESEQLGIPETEYKVNVRMPSAEFQRIIRDIGVFGDTCTYKFPWFTVCHCLSICSTTSTQAPSRSQKRVSVSLHQATLAPAISCLSTTPLSTRRMRPSLSTCKNQSHSILRYDTCPCFPRLPH